MSKIKGAFVIIGLAVLLFAAVSVSPVASEIATVESATATRTLPLESVLAGESFTVEIEASDYGIFGRVVETLPEGFCYVTSTLDPGSVVVEEETNTVKFTLFGETSFTYTVKAPDTGGTYTFSGILKDEYKIEYEVGGDTEIEVEEQPTISISTDKTSYKAGDKMYLSLDVKNPLDSAQRVSLDIYLEMPTGGTYTLMDTTVTLPAEFDYSNPDFKVFRLPPMASGTYTWHAILEDPVTGEIICEDIAEWEFAGIGGEELTNLPEC